MSASDIIRVTTGTINTVNDVYPGSGSTPAGPSDNPSYLGQVGKELVLDDDNLVFSSSMGTVYAGRFRYVKLAAAATAVVVGQIVFWDPTAAPNTWTVTTSEDDTTDSGVYPAGIVLNSGWSAGYYSFIQFLGLIYVQFRGTLTFFGAVGSAVYAAGAGVGADNGFADVISTGNPTLFSDVTLMQNRFLGTAYTAPVNGGLTLVDVNYRNVRG